MTRSRCATCASCRRRVYEEKLEEADEAASQLRAVLDANPGDADALAMLDRIFTREKQHFELLEILDLRVAGAEGPDQDALAFRAAELVEKELDDQSGAIARYRDILSRSPGHEGARQALWKIARDEAYRLQAVAALEPVLRSTHGVDRAGRAAGAAPGGRGDPGRAAGDPDRDRPHPGAGAGRFPAGLRRLGAAFAEEPVARPGRARRWSAWRRPPASSPGWPRCTAAGWRATSIPIWSRRWPGGWRSCTRSSWASRARRSSSCGGSSSVPGQEAPALARLEVLLDKLARYKELEEVLEREADVAVRQRRAGRLPGQPGRAAPVEAGQHGRGDASPSATRWSAQPTHAKALAALRGAAGRRRPAPGRGRHPGAAGRGPRRLRRAGRAVRGARGPGGQRAGEGAVVAPGRRRRRGEAATTTTAAIEALGQALKEDPSAPDTAEALERVARGRGQADGRRQADGGGLADLSRHLAGRAGAAGGGPVPAGAATGGAEHDAAAERLYRRALEEEPENARALEALEALYRRAGRHPARAAGQDPRAAGRQRDGQRAAAGAATPRRRASTRSWATRRRPSPAWQSVRDGDEGNAEALDELARLLEQQGNNQELVAVLEDRARFSDAARSGRRCSSASASCAGARWRTPTARPPRSGRCWTSSPDDRRALAALAALEEKRGDFAALEEVLLRRLSVAEGGERVETLLALAKNAEQRLHDNDRAASYLHQILETDPGQPRGLPAR